MFDLFWIKVKLRLWALLGHGSTALYGENEVSEWDQYGLGKAYTRNGFTQVTVQSFDNQTPIEHSLYIEARVVKNPDRV